MRIRRAESDVSADRPGMPPFLRVVAVERNRVGIKRFIEEEEG
jgi:hypothetical protein